MSLDLAVQSCQPAPPDPGDAIRRRRFGAAVCSVAGAWWCWAPAARLPVPAILAHAALLIAALALFAAASMAIRAYRGPAIRALNRGMLLGGIALEVGLILVGATLAVHAERSDLVLPVIAGSVGLHFLPLAVAFGYPPYVATGLAICAATFVSMLCPPAIGPTVLGAGVGASLLLTSLHMTMRLRRLSRGATK